MIDFDEIDEETEKALEKGEDVAGYLKENNQPRQGEVLEVMTRTWRLPGFDVLSENFRKQVPPWNAAPIVQKKPKVRLLVIHGVADSLNQGWHLLMAAAPPEIDVAMHEYPAHGHREESNEEILVDVDDLVDDCYEALKEAMDTGSFALLGHSIGCLILVRVAARARKELGVEPVMVYMIERGAPPYPKWTDEGLRMLKDDRVAFMEVFHPTAHSLYSTGTDTGERTMDLWHRSWQVENACLEVGWHVFECPLVAMYAEKMVEYVPSKEVAEFIQDEMNQKKCFWNAMFQRDEKGNLFTGHFPVWAYEEWGKWTNHELTVLNCRGADHKSIITDDKFYEMVFGTLQDIMKDW